MQRNSKCLTNQQNKMQNKTSNIQLRRCCAVADNTKAYKIVIHDVMFEISDFTLGIPAII